LGLRRARGRHCTRHSHSIGIGTGESGGQAVERRSVHLNKAKQKGKFVCIT
jgi:hypothetical protein